MVSEYWQKTGSFGFWALARVSEKTKCAILRVGFFVVCMFVNFCTIVCSFGLQLTFCGFV